MSAARSPRGQLRRRQGRLELGRELRLPGVLGRRRQPCLEIGRGIQRHGLAIHGFCADEILTRFEHLGELHERDLVHRVELGRAPKPRQRLITVSGPSLHHTKLAIEEGALW
jgi:hypothetical protein